MTEEKLTEQRDGQNVIALRQDGKRRWAITSAGMGEKSTRFLYGEYADKLAEYEEIGTVEECRAAVEKQRAKKPIIECTRKEDSVTEIEWKCPKCGAKYIELAPCGEWCRYCGTKFDWSDEE